MEDTASSRSFTKGESTTGVRERIPPNCGVQQLLTTTSTENGDTVAQVCHCCFFVQHLNEEARLRLSRQLMFDE